jgi:probable addiction module antidote protein
MIKERMKTTAFDASDYLHSEEDVITYLSAALEDGDVNLISAVLGDIAKSKGMSEISTRSGLSRTSLYKALSSDGNPELATILKVVKALGYRLQLEPINQ